MEKDFDRWNEHKKALDANAPRVYLHEREFWFVQLGTNVGFEQDGRGDESLRPVLVPRKFNNEVVWTLPLTRRNKPGNPYYLSSGYIVFPEIANAPLRSSAAILSQLRLLDIKRFRCKIGTMPTETFGLMKKKQAAYPSQGSGLARSVLDDLDDARQVVL